MMIPKPHRYRNEKYLDFVRHHPCCNCQAQSPSYAHHVSSISGTGQGTKPSDLFTVPLCDACHSRVHSQGYDTEYMAITVARMLAEWILREEDKHGD